MFEFRPEQIAQLRRKKIGDGLIETYAGSGMSAHRDLLTQDVLVSDPLGNASRFSFDASGLIGGVTTPTGRTWSLANYPDGKVGRLTNPAGHALGVTYTHVGQIESLSSNGQQRFAFEYNERQQLTRTHHPDGTVSTIDYDPFGTTVATTNRIGEREAYEHDEHRRLTSLSDGNGNRTTFNYGELNRPESTTYADGSTDHYSYDANGFLSKIISGGTVASIEHNAEGRPARIVYSDGEEIHRKYDYAGRLIESSNGGSKSTFTWDEHNRLASEQSDSGVIRYSYDSAGRLSALSYPGGDTVHFQWDADSRLALVQDWAGGEHHWQYDAHDGGWTLTGPNGVSTRTQVNSKGLPDAISITVGSTSLHHLGYAYDAEDRVHMLTDQHFGMRRYGYDAESQVTRVEASNPSQNEQFGYDKAGNLVYRSGVYLQVNALNQLTAIGNSAFDYDVRGNLTRMQTSDGIWRFTWNARNLMTSAQSPSGATTTYRYDSFGRRISKSSANIITRYVWAGEQMVSEITQSGQQQYRQDYLFYPGTHTPLATRIEGTVYSYHVDHLGTPRALTGPNGLIAWLADYNAFASANIANAQIRNPLRAPGQYFDDETGLHYNRFRYYSPLTGRYLSRDPASYLAGLNFYSYTSNNPINQADPSGLWGWKSIVATVAAVAVGVVVAVVLAPVALPLAIIAAGAAAGAVGFGLNQALNEDHFCLSCILKAAAKGLLVGALGAVPFALLPAAAGVAAFAAAGVASGMISYTANHVLTPGHEWSWSEFGESAALGGVFGAIGGGIANSGGFSGGTLALPGTLATAGGPELATAITVPAVSAGTAASAGAGAAAATGGPGSVLMSSNNSDTGGGGTGDSGDTNEPGNAGDSAGAGASGTKGPYSNLEDPPTVGPGKDFTAAQKAKIIQQNMDNNGGVVKSDQSGTVLTQPAKSQSGVTPDPNEWQIDHITAKDNGGTNSYSNAQVLSRAENRAKSNN